ncbi:MAG: hydrogenase maturation nickel metallochaperone HypA [Aquificaceae bacterium]|nr:MAG: hydrogenase maturation nickel metallochaperone HypA [Aquificaceae bacterium]
MHEFSIVSSLMTLIEDLARKHNAKKVTKVVVGVGVLSGVEPDLLKIAFDTFKEKTICEEAELILEIEKVAVKCMDCGKESQLEGRFSRKCPLCGSLNTEIVRGQDLQLKSLEFELED